MSRKLNKGEMMKLLYTQEELRHIDSALPMHYWKKLNTYWYVMNYNHNRMGALEDMRVVALQRGVDLELKDIPHDDEKNWLVVLDHATNNLYISDVSKEFVDDTDNYETNLYDMGYDVTNCSHGFVHAIHDEREKL